MCLFGISGTELHSKSKHTCLQWKSSELENHARTIYWRVIKGRGKTSKDDFAEKLLLIKVDSSICQSDKLPVILLYFLFHDALNVFSWWTVSPWTNAVVLAAVDGLAFSQDGNRCCFRTCMYLIQPQWCLSRSACCKYHRPQNTPVLSDMQVFDLSTDNNLCCQVDFPKIILHFYLPNYRTIFFLHKEKTTAPCSGLFFPW